MSSFNLINIVKIDFPMAHHRNEFEHDYVLHCSPNYILIDQDHNGQDHAHCKKYDLLRF